MAVVMYSDGSVECAVSASFGLEELQILLSPALHGQVGAQSWGALGCFWKGFLEVPVSLLNKKNRRYCRGLNNYQSYVPRKLV